MWGIVFGALRMEVEAGAYMFCFSFVLFFFSFSPLLALNAWIFMWVMVFSPLNSKVMEKRGFVGVSPELEVMPKYEGVLFAGKNG